MELKNILNFLSLVLSLESDLHSVHFSEVKSRIDEKLDASMRRFSIFLFNSQAPDVPELALRGIFQLSRLSVNCFVKTVKNISIILTVRILCQFCQYHRILVKVKRIL